MYLISVRAVILAMHHWPEAPDARAYLRDSHRHNFMVTANIRVDDGDRELEMHDLQENLGLKLESIPEMADSGQLDFGSMSCEHIGDALLKLIPEAVSIQVLEDDLHGATAYREQAPPEKEIKLVTVCGSTKFKRETEQAIAMLEERGDAAMSVGSFMHADEVELTTEQKERYDKLHLSKIAISDYVYVVNPEGYIGKSTLSEIKFAESLDKPIEYLFTRDAGTVRESLQTFMKDMEHKLRKNDYKGGWERLHSQKIFNLLQGEVSELSEALQDEGARINYIEDAINECADVANYAMMIADILRAKKVIK